MKAGPHVEEWDGLSDTLVEASPGSYELRLVSNAGRYENVAAVGNSGTPPTPDGHVPVSIASLAVDRDGAVFSANGWDEAGHDWKKWDRDGHSLMHANYQIRNGDPNGLPYRVAVDDRFLYAAYFSHNGERKAGSQWIERFDRRTGKAVAFRQGLRPQRPDPGLSAAGGGPLGLADHRPGPLGQHAPGAATPGRTAC